MLTVPRRTQKSKYNIKGGTVCSFSCNKYFFKVRVNFKYIISLLSWHTNEFISAKEVSGYPSDWLWNEEQQESNIVGVLYKHEMFGGFVFHFFAVVLSKWNVRLCHLLICCMKMASMHFQKDTKQTKKKTGFFGSHFPMESLKMSHSTL